MKYIFTLSCLLQLFQSNAEWHMETVTTIHARVQSDYPVWNKELKRYESSFGKDNESRYRAALDSVNTASVEGALMYVQAEGIDYTHVHETCTRKNNMQYVVFYEIEFAQPNAGLAEYQDLTYLPPEYCEFIAMDGGQCSLQGEKIPKSCEMLYGGGDGTNVGSCIGGAARSTNVQAPYDNTYWFSFPNSCVKDTWGKKTQECREAFPGGLCEPNVKPDGITCTYGYIILGYINLDRVTGIDEMIDSRTNKSYIDYKSFCEDKDGLYGGVEFDDGNEDGNITSIPFWEDPHNVTRNAERSQKMVELYSEDATKHENMKPLPSIQTLREKNPPCYKNSIRCARSSNGCYRDLYSQICYICKTPGANCVKAPADFEFPNLVKATPKPTLPPTTQPPITEAPTTNSPSFPTIDHTSLPTDSPTKSTTSFPTSSSTISPTNSPTASPTFNPTTSAAETPTTNTPTASPTKSSTASPTLSPTTSAAEKPNTNPTTSSPTTATTASSTSSTPNGNNVDKGNNGSPINKFSLISLLYLISFTIIQL